ncbi:MAG TPA: hypothetical protein VD735_05805 [Candidatus Saccharimonadales bacterium]|nr:hypothetical protein [Candidatus Saccharimonadales bacterium]
MSVRLGIHERHPDFPELAVRPELIPTLLGELALAQADYSRRHTACVLQTTDGQLVGGHVTEVSPRHFIAATDRALAKLPDDAGITGVYVTGNGPGVYKTKHIMPEPSAYDRLQERFSGRPHLSVVSPQQLPTIDHYEYAEHTAAYAPREPWALADVRLLPWGMPDDTPLHDTLLDDWDKAFMFHLQRDGRKHGIDYYLTGSSTGRGGVSNMLRVGYDDLDIQAVTDGDLGFAVDTFESQAGSVYGGYGELERRDKQVHVWTTGATVHGYEYRTDGGWYTGGPKSIDFFVGRSLAEITVRPEYIDRNFYIKLT